MSKNAEVLDEKTVLERRLAGIEALTSAQFLWEERYTSGGLTKEEYTKLDSLLVVANDYWEQTICHNHPQHAQVIDGKTFKERIEGVDQALEKSSFLRLDLVEKVNGYPSPFHNYVSLIVYSLSSNLRNPYVPYSFRQLRLILRERWLNKEV